tara:strand:- start:2458 stop:2700 length:243 start_codon:yes stop_codon:yes gene_type:complete
MIDTDKYEGVRTPFGIVPTEDILKMLEPIRERDNKIAELDAEVKRLREKLYEYEKYSICHPDATHCCDECLERNGFEVIE